MFVLIWSYTVAQAFRELEAIVLPNALVLGLQEYTKLASNQVLFLMAQLIFTIPSD